MPDIRFELCDMQIYILHLTDINSSTQREQDGRQNPLADRQVSRGRLEHPCHGPRAAARGRVTRRPWAATAPTPGLRICRPACPCRRPGIVRPCPRGLGEGEMSLDALLDELASYPGKAEESCFSLPPEAYLSSELHALEVRRIFERSWLCVGRDEYVAEPGDYYTIDVMDEPVIVVRGADGRVRALNAACRHRLMPVVEGQGNARRFVCPYHNWTYATDGRPRRGAAHGGQRRLRQVRLRTAVLPPRKLARVPVRQSRRTMPRRCGRPWRPWTAPPRINRIDEQTETFHYETEWRGNWKLSAENLHGVLPPHRPPRHDGGRPDARERNLFPRTARGRRQLHPRTLPGGRGLSRRRRPSVQPRVATSAGSRRRS